jgi:hypothetical protein
MRFTQEVSERIADRINQVAAGARCPLCQTAQFTVADGFFVAPLRDMYPSFFKTEGEKGIPCAALVCNTCGNTFFINLITIGLGDLLKWA